MLKSSYSLLQYLLWILVCNLYCMTEILPAVMSLLFSRHLWFTSHSQLYVYWSLRLGSAELLQIIIFEVYMLVICPSLLIPNFVAHFYKLCYLVNPLFQAILVLKDCILDLLIEDMLSFLWYILIYSMLCGPIPHLWYADPWVPLEVLFFETWMIVLFKVFFNYMMGIFILNVSLDDTSKI